MKRSDFFYELPQELIALQPLAERDHSRLLIYERGRDHVEHRQFCNLPQFLKSGDCLVLNNSRVQPVRFLGRRKSGARIEVLLVKAEGSRVLAFVRGKGRVKNGEILELEEERIPCRLIERCGHWGQWWVDFPEHTDPNLLFEKGRAPLPPYISWARKGEENVPLDRSRYQTVFAAEAGSIAAPTAGLHFTQPLLSKIREAGVQITEITLHVGPGTFLPVREEEVEKHTLLAERYTVSAETADLIAKTKQNGRRVVAVGTTVTRVLEGVSDAQGRLKAQSGECSLFIYPPYKFRVVDALITNFHLPESTLLMLVCAFLGKEKCLELYQAAVREKYRFFSYGDAMLLL